jgi:REP element-mobilizing transposase RayT
MGFLLHEKAILDEQTPGGERSERCISSSERGCVQRTSRSDLISSLASNSVWRFHLVMQPTDRPPPSGPPHNPQLRDLVDAKRQWSPPLETQDIDAGFRGWHERGYLPHRDEPGLIQFVTFRLADCFPEARRSEWEHLLKVEDDFQRRAALEEYLDKGRGECFLRRPEIAQLVEDAVRFFHGKRYELLAWVVMPNHAHALFEVSTTPMADILESWKKHTANKANRLLQRKGRFWQADYWDTYMRDSQHELETRTYIESNPVSAGLVLDPKAWPWSSARFRNEFGELRL